MHEQLSRKKDLELHCERLTIDPNGCLVDNPEGTFLIRVQGDSMAGAGILPGDLLVVDSSIDAKAGNIIIAEINKKLTLKRLIRNNGSIVLKPENSLYNPITIRKNDKFSIRGVVKYVIRDYI